MTQRVTIGTTGVLRFLRSIAAKGAVLILVVLFNFAVIGVFGLLCAIVSSVVGIAFSIVTAIITNKRTESALR